MEELIKLALSFLTVLIFFQFYFRNFVFSRSMIWQSKSFFFGLLSSVAAIVIQRSLPPVSSPAVEAFINAAVVEETLRYVIIYVRVRRSSMSFSVTEGVFDGILLALGFAFAENLHYSVSFNGPVILLRCISSVPMHVFASGIMAYFLSYSQLCRERRKWYRVLNFYGRRRVFLALVAYIVPVVFHGLFDYSLFRGGDWTYFIPPLLIIGYLYLDYLIARGRLVFGKNILLMVGIDADDQDIIQRQQQYEKWMSDFQDAERESLHVFNNQWTLVNTIAGSSLFVLAGIMAWIHIRDPEMIINDPSVQIQAKLSLLVYLPLAIGAILLFSDKINYLFFRDYMLRLPGGAMVSLTRENGETLDTIVLDIRHRGVFLTGLEELRENEKLTLHFFTSKHVPVPVSAAIKWVNQGNPSLPIGALCQFVKSGWRFSLFRFVYNINKIRIRILFNMDTLKHRFLKSS